MIVIRHSADSSNSWSSVACDILEVESSHRKLSLIACIPNLRIGRVMKATGGKDTRLVVDRSVKGDDGFTDEERDKRVQEVSYVIPPILIH